MKRIFSAGRGLAFIVFMTVFLFTGCGGFGTVFVTVFSLL